MADMMIPEGWRKGELSDFCDVVGGGTPDRNNPDFWRGDIPWASPTEITNLTSKYISQTKENITKLGLDKSSAKLHPADTLLMTSRASIGYVAINTVPMATNQGFQSLRCKEKILVDFLYQYIAWSRPQLERLAAGSTFAEISSANVKKLEVCVPPLPEQQKIATILTSVDTVIEKTRAQIDKLKHLKTGMMQELLTQGIGHTEFKDSPVGRIPKSWKFFTIEDILESIIDYRGKSPPKSEVGIPLITAKNIRQGYIDVNPKEYIYEEQYDSWMVRGFPVEGDVFITTEAPLGNVARVPTYKFAIGQRVLTLRPKEFVATDYLFYMMQGQYFREQLDLESTGSTVAGIKQSTFRNILVPLPSKAEQLEIAKPLNALNRQIDVVQEKLQGMEAMKKALMQDLLTGKVRVDLS